MEEDIQGNDCLTHEEQSVASSVTFRLCIGSAVKYLKHMLTPAKQVVREHGKEIKHCVGAYRTGR